MDQQYLLRLNVPPNLEEDVVDVFLVAANISGFQSYPTRGHGTVGAMTIAEQVEGRRNRIQFEVVLGEEFLEDLLDLLKEKFPVADVIYWVLPVVRSGRLFTS